MESIPWWRGRSWVDDGCVYFIAAPEVKRVKIGYSAGHPSDRLASLQTASPVELVPLGIVLGGVTRERKLHDRYADFRVIGEWFRHKGRLRDFVRGSIRAWPDALPSLAEVEAAVGVDRDSPCTIVESAVIAGVNMLQMRSAIRDEMIRFERAGKTSPNLAPLGEVLRFRDAHRAWVAGAKARGDGSRG